MMYRGTCILFRESPAVVSEGITTSEAHSSRLREKEEFREKGI